ncbi:MAG TPA: hypothetical protein VGR53_06485 [Nitrososphaerales archaeon]|nr:hypothetical protein [Nitrososphaerales archaeon]
MLQARERVFSVSVSTILLLGTFVGVTSMGLAGVAPVYAVLCPTFVTNNSAGAHYVVRITGADGSCVTPVSYDNSGASPGRAHVNLGTGGAQNPYTVTLVSCSGATCPPSQIWIGGWGPGNVGSSPYTLPFSFTLNAGVQAGIACTTAPLKVDSNKGVSIIQLEAGTGCSPASVCPPSGCPPTSGVPEFPLGIFPILLLAIPFMLLLRKRIVSAPVVRSYS